MSLSKEALLSSAPLVKKYDSLGYIVSPLENSPLALLCAATECVDYTVSGDATMTDGFEINVDSISRNTNEPNPLSGISRQNLDMSEIVRVVSESVNGQLLLAKTVVAPMVEDLVQRTAGELEAASRSNLLDLEIKIKRLPAPLHEQSLVDEIFKAKDIPSENFTIGMEGPTQSSEQVLALLQTGSGSLDASIAEFVATSREGLLAEVWGMFFTITDEQTSGGTAVFDAFRLGDGVSFALIAHLIARKIWDNPIEGFNASAANYERQVVAIRDQSAIYLGGVIERQERAEKNGILVVSFNGKVVEVNEKTYREWIADGGDNETIFGACMAGKGFGTVSELREHAGDYARRWQHFLGVNATTLENQRFSRAKEIVSLEFTALWRDITEDLLPIVDREAAMNRFNEALCCTTMSETKDLYCWAMRLLTSSIFYKTDAFKILQGIHEARKRDPGLEPNEAAALSAISYIGWWVATQLKVSRVYG